ncbi:MAG TPA: FHA domain-containing protein [Planctomycetota bacterium]|nr:FHA domain-containing protein [Planctomycetota bacterium]
MASLTIIVEGVEQKVPLESASVTLGRGLESDVRLKDIKASRRHCQIVKMPKGYECVDLSSGNGTYINGIQIKSQILSPGDKITIGSTTILFQETPKATASPKAATAKLPAVAAAAPPPPPKPASGRMPTARVQVAPTKRTTARAEPVKSGSQGGLKPVGQTGSKSGSRLGKAVPRPSTVRPPRAPVEAPAKKSPLLLVGAGVALLALGVGAYLFFGGHDKSDQIKEQIEQLAKKGDAERDQDHLDLAIQDYRAALALCQGDRYKLRASDLSKRIAQTEARKGSGPPKPEPKDSPDREGEFAARKTEIVEKRKLGDPSAADWAGALKDWAEFASRKTPGDASRAQGEIRTLQGKAQEEAARLKSRADALAKENKSAEAVDFLKHQIERFEGTDARAGLDAALKQFDQ